jgi:flagellar assembly protein FliH
MGKAFTAETRFHVRRGPVAPQPTRRLADLLREQDLAERAETEPPRQPAAPVEPAHDTTVEAADPAPPTVDREAIEAEIEARVDAAREAVAAELRAEREAALNAATAAIAVAVEREATAHAAARAKDAATIARLVGAIAHTVVPRAARSLPLDDLADVLNGLLARLDVPTEIEVTVHPSLRQDLADHLAERPEAVVFRERLRVVADPALEVGDARVRWPSGQAERDLDHLVDEAVTLCASWLEDPRRTPAPAATFPAPERTRA